MGRKHTRYTGPSMAQQIKNGAGTIEEIEKLLTKLASESASPKTLKRIRKQLEQRKRNTPLKKGTFSE